MRYVSAQIGHEDPRFTLKVYAQATRRRERLSETHRRAHDQAIDPELERVPATAEATRNPA
jgi:hypothetical protein